MLQNITANPCDVVLMDIEMPGMNGIEATQLIKKHFPLAVLETVSNAGHWLHAENPKEFFEITRTFLK